MEILKEAAKGQIAIPGCVVELMARSLIVPVVDELARIMIDRVGPVWILSRREKYDQVLVFTPAR